MAAQNGSSTSTAMSTRPCAVQGVVEYKPTPMQQKTIDILGSPEGMAVLAPLIPKGVEFDAVAIEVYRAATKVPAILECTPESIVMAVADCLRVGLIIGRTIHLVPVKNTKKGVIELQAWTDYKGDIELVVAAGGARHVEAHAVYARDRFEPHLGTDPHIVHVPEMVNERGPMVAAYSVAFITNMLRKVCVMRMDEIEKIRKTSRQWSPEKVTTCPEWYALKTTIHRVCKDLPKNAKLAKVLDVFARQDEIDHEEGLSPDRRVEGTATISPNAAGDGAVFDEVGPDYNVEDVPAAAAKGDTAPAPEPAAEEFPDVPSCPTCDGEMWDNRQVNDKRAAEGKKLMPEFKCKRQPECPGLYWRGQWPPKPEDPRQESLHF